MINNSYYQIDLWIYLGDTHHMHFQTPSPFLLPRLKRKQDKKTIYPILSKHQPVGALCSSQQRHRSDSSDEPLDGNYGEADIKVDWSKCVTKQEYYDV